MYVIGLTGGVGSGKTVVAHRLAEMLDAHILIADELGHVAMEKNAEGYKEIIKVFGDDILDDAGEIDRKRLSGLVFSDTELLEQLNRIVHPAVRSYIREYIDKYKSTQEVLILETAIMFETGCNEFCDEIWYVYVPREVRMERLAKNRGYSEDKSLEIMKQQLKEEEYRGRCKHEICNDGTLEELDERLGRLLEEKFPKEINI